MTYLTISFADYTLFLPLPFSPCIPSPISISSSCKVKVGGKPGIEHEDNDTPIVKIFSNNFVPSLCK